MKQLIFVHECHIRPRIGEAIGIAEDCRKTGRRVKLFGEGLVEPEVIGSGILAVPLDTAIRLAEDRISFEYSLARLNAIVWASKREDAESMEFIRNFTEMAAELGEQIGSMAAKEINHTYGYPVNKKEIGENELIEIVNAIVATGIIGIAPVLRSILERLGKSTPRIFDTIQKFEEACQFLATVYKLHINVGIPSEHIVAHLEPRVDEDPLRFARRYKVPISALKNIREIFMAYVIAREEFDIGVVNCGLAHVEPESVFLRILNDVGIRDMFTIKEN